MPVETRIIRVSASEERESILGMKPDSAYLSGMT